MKNISILIAEDDEILREQLVESIELQIDTIYQTDNGMDAYDMYKKYNPSIILSDIHMPRLNGLGLIEKIRKEDKDTKIIILSAYTEVAYFQKAVELHLVSYLIKPIPSGQLRDAINKSIKSINKSVLIQLIDNYFWDTQDRLLYKYNELVKLSRYELLFIECLVKSRHRSVSYEAIHNFVYDMQDYSKDAISSLVKRLRKKTDKDMIISSHGEGYRIA